MKIESHYSLYLLCQVCFDVIGEVQVKICVLIQPN